MVKNRKIIAFTGMRSEYDLQYSVVKYLNTIESVDFGFIVFGAHLSEKFGNTLKNIENDGFNIIEKIFTNPEDDSSYGKVKCISILLSNLSEIFLNQKPDLIIVTGDREEVITASIAATYFNIPICHLFGGDKTFPDALGDIDEQIRNSTTKLAHLHFVIHDEHKDRVLKMGEESWRVKNFGSPALDKYSLFKGVSLSDLSNYFNTKIKKKKYCVLIHHSLPNNIEESILELNNILEVLKILNITTFISYPNNDPGFTKIIDCIEFHSKSNSKFIIYKNLSRDYFISLISNASFLIGNSSMGILECPFLLIPSINVGKRQQDRLNAGNVIFCDNKLINIQSSIEKAVHDKVFKANLKKSKHFYGDGYSGKKIANFLANVPIDRKLIAKKITY